MDTGFKAVLFDAGGTLIYQPRNPAEILRDQCARLGVSIDLKQAGGAYRESERFFAAHYLSYSGEQNHFWDLYHGEALRYLGISDPTGEKAKSISHGFAESGAWEAFPEAAGVCQQLRSAGFRLGVISNGPINVSDMLSQAGLLPFFEIVVTSQGAGIEKPAPRIFHEALNAMALPPEEVLFVGDLYDVDVVGARAVGMEAVLIDREGLSEQRECVVIRSLDDLLPLVIKE